MSRYDAIIIGSGPAALSAALTLAEQRIQVLLLTTDTAPGGGSLVQGCFELEPGPWHWTLPALGCQEQPCWTQLLSGGRLDAERKKRADRQRLSDLLAGADQQAVSDFWSLAEQNLDWLHQWYGQGVAAKTGAPPVLPPEIRNSAVHSLDEMCTTLKLPTEALERLKELTPLLGVSEMSFGPWAARLLQYLKIGFSRPVEGWYSWSLRLLERLEELGGTVRLGCPLKGFLWRNDRIAGVSTPLGDDRSPALIWAESDERPLWELLREASSATAQMFRPQIALREARDGWQRQTLRMGLLPGTSPLPPVQAWLREEGLLQAQALPCKSGLLLTLSTLSRNALTDDDILADYTDLSGFDPRPCIKEMATDDRPWPQGGSLALAGDDALARALALPQEAAVHGLYLAGPAQALTCDIDGLLACGRFAARKVKN